MYVMCLSPLHIEDYILVSLESIKFPSCTIGSPSRAYVAGGNGPRSLGLLPELPPLPLLDAYSREAR